MNTLVKDRIENNLQRLRLPRVREILLDQVRVAEKKDVTYV